MTTAKKFFSKTVTLPTLGPTSVATMMATAGWGFERDSSGAITTIPSMDSTIGTGLTIVPLTSTVWVGSDQYVRDVDSTGPPALYMGVLIVANDPYGISEFSRGLVDINEVWIWNPAPAQSIQIIFKGL